MYDSPEKAKKPEKAYGETITESAFDADPNLVDCDDFFNHFADYQAKYDKKVVLLEKLWSGEFKYYYVNFAVIEGWNPYESIADKVEENLYDTDFSIQIVDDEDGEEIGELAYRLDYIPYFFNLWRDELLERQQEDALTSEKVERIDNLGPIPTFDHRIADMMAKLYIYENLIADLPQKIKEETGIEEEVERIFEKLELD
jgi:hypothetical protein